MTSNVPISKEIHKKGERAKKTLKSFKDVQILWIKQEEVRLYAC